MSHKHGSAAFEPVSSDKSSLEHHKSNSILQKSQSTAQQSSLDSKIISSQISNISIDTSAMREILNDRQMEKTIIRIAHQIIEKNESQSYSSLILLGIPRSGVFLAYRLAQYIESYSELKPEVGVLDITMYRDDLHHGAHRAVQASHIPAQGIDDACVILVDDVLFTGRSVRSALDAMRDIGRPSHVQLAVLVDRGHRELPIRADYVGKNLPTARKEKVEVFFAEDSGQDGIYLSYPEETTSDTSKIESRTGE